MINITFLEKLAKACLKVDWEKLPDERKVGIPKELGRKYSKLIKEYRKLKFQSGESKIGTIEGKSFILLNVEEDSVEYFTSDIDKITDLLKSYNFDPDVSFDDTTLKIELK
jgi:hypothetical protein